MTNSDIEEVSKHLRIHDGVAATFPSSVPDAIGLTIRFMKEVQPHTKQIDPRNEYDWDGLVVGWGLGCGLKPKQARTFSTFLRYDTDLA